MRRLQVIALLSALLFSLPVFAQSNVTVNFRQNSGTTTPVSPAQPLPITGSFSAGTFAPGGAYATLTATGSSADAALPSGAAVIAFNTGTTAVSCQLTIGSGVATASMNVIQASSWLGFSVGSNTHISCIDQTGSASNVIVVSGGSGSPTGAGGGGGGSGGAVTIADGSGSGGAKVVAGSSAATDDLALVVSDPNALAAINSPVPAGTNTIGNVNPAPNVSPTDCSGTIGTGDTSQTAISAQTTLHGFTIMNIDASTGSGEPLWIAFTGSSAAASTVGSYALSAPTATTFVTPGSFTTPPGFGTNHAVFIVGHTTGHKYSCTWW